MMSKNQIIWTTRCKVMAKYISIYFSKIWFPLVSDNVHKIQKMSFFGDLGFSSVILVNMSLKALCLSSKMVY